MIIKIESTLFSYDFEGKPPHTQNIVGTGLQCIQIIISFKFEVGKSDTIDFIYRKDSSNNEIWNLTQ